MLFLHISSRAATINQITDYSIDIKLITNYFDNQLIVSVIFQKKVRRTAGLVS